MFHYCSTRHINLSLTDMMFESRSSAHGPDRVRLEALARDLDLQTNTEFIGAVPIGLISDVLSEAIAVVMPSTWEDVAPMVAIEQMMQGRLVIAADVGGLGETGNGFGLKFPPGDISGFEVSVCVRRSRTQVYQFEWGVKLGRML